MSTKRKQSEAGGTKKKSKTEEKKTFTTTSSSTSGTTDDGYEADEEGDGDMLQSIFLKFVTYLKNQGGMQDMMTMFESTMMW